MYKNPITIFLISGLLLIRTVSYSQDKSPVFVSHDAKVWADSVFNTMSYEQKIGQLFMVDAYSNRDAAHTDYIAGLIRNYYVGGVIFFQGGPVRQARMTNYFQSISPVQLMIGIDGEWGLSMRLDSTIRFPRQMTLGATGSNDLVYKMAREIGRQCKRMGIHLNFAPVADINNNPRNPVINSRSFGERKEQVSDFAVMYTRGLQEEGVMACGKHFPGHGNTDSDSHFTLPVIKQSAAEIDSLELYPFRELQKAGIASMMVAHLQIPSLDSTPNLAGTLSPAIVTDLLKKKMGYEGLIFTDALNMKGVADYYPSGEVELKALLAGNDVLLYSSDVPKAWLRIHIAIQNCEIEQEVIDEKVKRILMAKFWAGLNKPAYVELKNLIEDLNPPEADYLNQQLYERSITLLRNEKNTLPIKQIPSEGILSIVVNDTINNPFQLMMGNYAKIDKLRIGKGDPSAKLTDSIIAIADCYETVILSIHNTSTKAESGYGISDKINELILNLQTNVNLITVVFGNAYTLTKVPGAFKGKSLVLSYEDTNWPQYFTAQAIFGASHVSGKLPVSPMLNVRAGEGKVLSTELNRLRFTVPYEMGLKPDDFITVDALAQKAINDKATPGCQVLVAWKGNVIYQKSFGSFTYEKNSQKVKNSDLYDIASITKIASTALATMKLYDEGDVDLDKRASKYFHPLKKTNKKDLVIEDILTHQAGLKSWIPFWKQTLENGKPSFNIFHYEKDVNYSVQVADSFFILNSYEDKIWKEIYDSPVEPEGTYVYSDLGTLLMQKVIEEVTEQSLNNYVNSKFYEPLGLTRFLYNPADKFSLKEIVPTEMDSAFRKRLVHGFVHDPAAAMMGGVAGHAGLFSDAYNLAVIMQMLLNKGEYGGVRYLSEEAVTLFTSRYFKEGNNRRGLIFDKPEFETGKNGNTALAAAPSTFGHTGFTGTAAWADPDNELVFIFLSNRVYPDSKINKLAQGNYRTDIMQAVYDIIMPVKSQPSKQ